MKVLLIQPPVQDFYDTDIRLQPLGLCMLKAAVRKFLPHVEVIVRDYHQGYERKTIPYPTELSYLRDYYLYPDTSPFSMFHQYYHFGATFEEVGKDVSKENPDLVGISSLFSPYYREALACAKEIKKRLDISIITGGTHVSASPLSMLKDPNVDFIIRGEGERPFVEFLQAVESGGPLEGVPNLGFKRNGEPVLNPMGEPYSPEELPFADLSDLPPDRYLFKRKPICFLSTSRGCPHGCTFCSVHLTFGEKFRKRSIEDVISEIKMRYGKGYRVFDFEDDNLTFYRDDFKRLLTRLIAEFPRDEVRFAAMNGISYLSLDREILELMKRAGFSHLNISLVTADATVLGRVHRPHSFERYLKVVQDARALGFEIVSYQIVGLPYDTLENMIHTMAIMAALPVLIGVSIFYLTPGCPLTREFPCMTESDILKARSTAMAIETDLFCRDDLYTLFITARIINFIKGIRLGKKRVAIQEALDAAARLGKRAETGLALVKRLFEEKRLYASTKHGFKPLSHFRTDLFFRVWERSPYIISQEGTLIKHV